MENANPLARTVREQSGGRVLMNPAYLLMGAVAASISLVVGWWVGVGELILGAASAAVLSATLLWSYWMRTRRQWQQLHQRLERAAGATPAHLQRRPIAAQLAWQVDQIASRMSELSHRSAQVHPVSGLPTREPLINAIEDAPDGGTLGLVELCDFDRLTLFDAAIADEVLSEIAQRLVRMVGPGRVLAHVDRSRFAIWSVGVDPDVSRTELNAICYALRDRVVTAGVELLPQLRSALVESSRDKGSASELVSRGLSCLSDPIGHISAAEVSPATSRDLFLLEQDLRQATARNEFELWYQPFIDAAEQKVCGAEALLRWRHPEHGLVMPARFIPVMESANLAEEIGLWTLNAGCREARNWQQHQSAPLKVAINLSAHQLTGGQLPLMVGRTLQRHGLPPTLLELELTETVASVDSAAARILFDELRTLGVAVSIDDFGAGYSSLSYLKKLHFDKIKIDREFISHVDRQSDSQAICQSIIALGRGLGIPVLAEGVERAEEYQWLRRHGCTLFQGFYFSRPLEAAAFLPFVRDSATIAQLTGLSASALQNRVLKR